MLAGLTTRGRCLLAAGIAAAICAWILNERDLLRVAAFITILPLMVAVFLALSKVRISATRRLLPHRVVAGQPVTVELEVARTSRLTSGELLLEDGVTYALGNRPRFIARHLPFKHPARLSYGLRPDLRGVHHIGPLQATVTDPFGLCEFDSELTGTSQLIVVPRTERLDGLAPGAAGVGDEGALRQTAGPGEPDAVVRQYRQGDDLRMVHWPSTARQDELMVRVEQRPARSGTTVLLDRRAAAHHGSGKTASIEWAVSFAASVCLHLRRRGQDVRLVTEHARTLAQVQGSGGDAADNLVLDALAMLRPAHQRDITLGHDPAVGEQLVAVLGSVSNKAIAELARYRARGTVSRAVLLDTAAWSSSVTAPGTRRTAAHTSARMLQAAGWTVVIAGPRSDFADVWRRLCTADRSAPPTVVSR